MQNQVTGTVHPFSYLIQQLFIYGQTGTRIFLRTITITL